jgi:hypothetical protein
MLIYIFLSIDLHNLTKMDLLFTHIEGPQLRWCECFCSVNIVLITLRCHNISIKTFTKIDCFYLQITVTFRYLLFVLLSQFELFFSVPNCILIFNDPKINKVIKQCNKVNATDDLDISICSLSAFHHSTDYAYHRNS